MQRKLKRLKKRGREESPRHRNDLSRIFDEDYEDQEAVGDDLDTFIVDDDDDGGIAVGDRMGDGIPLDEAGEPLSAEDLE